MKKILIATLTAAVLVVPTTPAYACKPIAGSAAGVKACSEINKKNQNLQPAPAQPKAHQPKAQKPKAKPRKAAPIPAGLPSTGA